MEFANNTTNEGREVGGVRNGRNETQHDMTLSEVDAVNGK